MTDPQPENTPPPGDTPPDGAGAPAAGDPPKNDPPKDEPKNDPPKDEPKDGEPFVDEDGEKFNFPTNTSLSEMKPEQREEYWRHKAKKHEKLHKGLTAKLEREAMSAQEKAVADAREEARAEALKEARVENVRAIMDAHVTASGLDKAKPNDKDVIDAIQALDPSSFIKEDHVEADRLTKVLNQIIPAKGDRQWPDTGQGNRNTGTGSARDAGKAEAARRWPDKVKDRSGT